MNGTKAILAGALALLGLIAYKETTDILFESVVYGRDNYQGYAVFMVLAVASAAGSLVSLVLSFNFVERWINQEPRSEAQPREKVENPWETKWDDWDETPITKQKSYLDDETF